MVGLELKDNYLVTGASALSLISRDMPLTQVDSGWLQCPAVSPAMPQLPHSHCYITMGCRGPSAKVCLQTQLRSVRGMSSYRG